MHSLLQGMARYHAWASDRLNTALIRVPPAVLARRFDFLAGSIGDTLAHLVEADRLWYERIAHGGVVQGDVRRCVRSDAASEIAATQDAARTTPGTRDDPGDGSAAAGCSEMVEQARRWSPLIDSLDVGLPFGELAFEGTHGTAHHFPLAACVLLVFNQATHHRGQLCAALVAAGFEAPDLDLWRMLTEGRWPSAPESALQDAAAGLQEASGVRDACVEAALDAWEDAGIRGLCAEGRWEVAIGAMQSLDLHPGSGAP